MSRSKSPVVSPSTRNIWKVGQGEDLISATKGLCEFLCGSYGNYSFPPEVESGLRVLQARAVASLLDDDLPEFKHCIMMIFYMGIYTEERRLPIIEAAV